MAIDQIRPLSLDDFTGQEECKKKIQIAVTSAKKRKKPLGHVLLSGPAGTGKTSFAQIIANLLEVDVHNTVGTVIKNDKDVFNIINATSRKERFNVLFIDEIHAIPAAGQDNLLTAMEDGKLNIKKGDHSQRFGFAPIVIVAATTNPGKISKPVYDRFDHKLVFTNYTVTELKKIVQFTVSKLDSVTKITDTAAMDIARRSRGVARISTKYVKSCQDIAVVKGVDKIDAKVVNETFKMLDINEQGLSSKVDIKILKYLFHIYPQAVGIDSMAELLDEDSRHIKGIVEPNLFKLLYIDRVRGGRAITPKGIAYLKEKGYLDSLDVETAVYAIQK